MEWSGARESELMLERQVGSTLSAHRRRPKRITDGHPTDGPVERVRSGPARNARPGDRAPRSPVARRAVYHRRPRALNRAAGTESPPANPHRKERRAMSATTHRAGTTSATPYPYTPSWRDEEMRSNVLT